MVLKTKKHQKEKLSAREFKTLYNFLEKKSGLCFDKGRREVLEISLRERMKIRQCFDFRGYYQFLRFHREKEVELRELWKLVTINETCFFRNPAQFEVLATDVIPKITRAKSDKHLSFWSAGCSSGEEPYSIAIFLLKVLSSAKNWRIRILGTDIYRDLLHIAKEGVYGERSLRLVEEEDRKHYFEKVDVSYRQGEKAYIDRYFKELKVAYKLKNRAKKMVDFKLHNLVTETPPLAPEIGWDVIFCRNVLIYFTEEAIHQAIAGFYESLKEGGYLFLGSAENYCNFLERIRFSRISNQGLSIYRKERKSSRATVVQSWTPKTENDQKPDLKNKHSREKKKPHIAPGFSGVESKLENSLVESQDMIKSQKQTKHLQTRSDSRNKALRLTKEGEIYTNQGHYKEAKLQYLKALEIDPLLVEAHYLLGVVYRQQRKNKEALDQFKKTLYLDKNFVPAYFCLALTYKERGKNKAAIREYNNALRVLHEEPIDKGKLLRGFNKELLVESCKRGLKQLKKQSASRSKD